MVEERVCRPKEYIRLYRRVKRYKELARYLESVDVEKNPERFHEVLEKLREMLLGDLLFYERCKDDIKRYNIKKLLEYRLWD